MRFRFIVTALLFGMSLLYGGEYKVDPQHSEVSFAVKHMLISTVRGHFGKFSGSFVYDEKTKQLKALKGVIDANSVDTRVAARDEDLRSPNFFDVAKYPKITYVLSYVKKNTAYGKLTIHGITKTVAMHLEKSGLVIKDPWGNIRTGISLSGTIDRKEFGLKWNKLLAAGGALVGDKVKINVTLEGILKK
jgi:polyisoprenoid-binding protein YceI